ncbi:CorA metal ion transporter [Malassezia sp. CBS 17886]|nr:CorA metal ion transporter [Malassezia sp. CBS 17886]
MSFSPQSRYHGTPSGPARKLSDPSLSTSPRLWNEHHPESDAQREQDLDAARQLSRAREGRDPGPGTAASPLWHGDEAENAEAPDSAAAPARSAATAVAMKHFYQQKQHGSSTSLDSQSNFIDHRNQSHSLSVNPNSPLAMRASQGIPSAREAAASGTPSIPVPVSSSDRPRQRLHVADASASGTAPPANVASPGARGGGTPEFVSSPHSIHTGSGRQSDLEDDVCFPPPSQMDAPPDPQVSIEAREPEARRLGFPYPFDMSVLESFANEEREQLGLPSKWTAMPAMHPAGDRARRASIRDQHLASGDALSKSSDAKLYSRRPRKIPSPKDSGNKYQRKLTMFEGNSPAGSSFTPAGTFGTSAEEVKSEPRPPPHGASHGSFAGNASGTMDGANELRKRLRSHTQPPAGGQHPDMLSSVHEKPYRFTFWSNALPSTVHARYLSELPAQGQTFDELLRGVAPKDADAPRTATQELETMEKVTGEGDVPGGAQEENTWWLDVLCPTDQEMKTLSRTFGIHPLTTEDIMMEEAREKIELFRNYYFVCFRSFDQDPYSPTYLEPLNMYIVVLREGTLSFHFRHTPHPANVRRRIKQLKDYINVTSDWISYALIDDITDAFGPLIQSIEFEVESIDELVLILKEAEQSDMLRRIGTCRKKVMGLLRLMGNKADVVKGLAKRCNEYWAVAPRSDIGLYLSDIQDHLITMTQNLNHYELILSRSHSNYLAQISIEMIDANNQINDVLSKLTALGTVIVPMNVITGLWGMNVEVPGQDIDNLNWFGGIVSFIVVIAVIGYVTTVRYLQQ